MLVFIWFNMWKLGETNFHPSSIHSRLWGPALQYAKYLDTQIPRPTHTWILRGVLVPVGVQCAPRVRSACAQI